MAENRQPDFWFSTKTGKHVPVYKKAGESKEEAIKRTAGEFKTKSSSGPEKKTVNAEPKSKSGETKRDGDKKSDEIKKAKSTADKLNAEAEYRDKLSKGVKITSSGSSLSFNGKQMPKLDTHEAGDDPETDSLRQHIDANGNISPERAKVHAKIVQQYFDKYKPYAPGDEKVAMFTGGGGASGKGIFSKTDKATGHRNIGDYYSQDKNPMIIDPDAIKSLLAEADGTSLGAKSTNAGLYHEESSALAKQIYATALENNYPVMYDGTATGKGIYGLLDLAEKAGYKTEMNFLFSDWKSVRANSLKRYEKGFGTEAGARLVPLGQVIGAHAKAFNAVQNLAGKVDSFTLWDNAGYRMGKVASCKRGEKLNIEDKAAYEKFSKSAQDFTLTGQDAVDYELDVYQIGKRHNAQEFAHTQAWYDNAYFYKFFGEDALYKEAEQRKTKY